MTLLTKSFASATGIGWTNITRVLVDDSLSAQSPYISNNSTGAYIELGNPFGSNPIPSTWMIEGVELSVKGKVQVSGQAMAAYQCSLRKNGIQYSVTTPTSSNFSTTVDSVRSVPSSGGSTYLWGRSSILYSDLNDPTFVVRVPIRNIGSPQYFYANFIAIKIYYTDLSTGTSGNSQQFFWSTY